MQVITVTVAACTSKDLLKSSWNLGCLLSVHVHVYHPLSKKIPCKLAYKPPVPPPQITNMIYYDSPGKELSIIKIT